MKTIALVLGGMLLAGCSGSASEAEEFGVTKERFSQWSGKTVVSKEKHEAVRASLRVAARGHSRLSSIKDPAERAEALARWEEATRDALRTMNGAGAELFEEAGLLGGEPTKGEAK